MRTLGKLALVLALALAVPALATAQERQIQWGSGPPGGSWIVGIGAGTQVLNERTKGLARFQMVSTNGAVENMRRVALGELDYGWTHVSTLFNAWHGSGKDFEGRPPLRNFRVIAKVDEQTQIFVVLKDSEIQSLKDIVGKKVALSPVGSGSETNSRNILTALGLYDKVQVLNMGFAAGGNALGNRQVDLYSSAGVGGTMPIIVEISQKRPVRYLGLTDEEFEKVRAKYPYYAKHVLPAQIPGVQGHDRPVSTVKYGVYWIAKPDVPDEIVERTLALVTDPANRENLIKAQASWKGLDGDFSGIANLGFPLHPAAVRFWKGKGFDIPANLIPKS
jgi:TRAP transporter TAXI family solute receptor